MKIVDWWLPEACLCSRPYGRPKGWSHQWWPLYMCYSPLFHHGSWVLVKISPNLTLNVWHQEHFFIFQSPHSRSSPTLCFPSQKATGNLQVPKEPHQVRALKPLLPPMENSPSRHWPFPHRQEDNKLPFPQAQSRFPLMNKPGGIQGPQVTQHIRWLASPQT